MSLFRRIRPLLLTSFINKCGAIGLGLLPMVMVQRGYAPGTSTWITSLIRGAALLGSIFGGWLTDRIGLKSTVLIAFGLSSIGLGLVPFTTGAITLCILGILAQTGQVMFPSAARLMLTRLVGPHDQQESIGWLRSANNLAQILSFSVGWIFSALGTTPLLFMDAISSTAALLVGSKVLPSESRSGQNTSKAPSNNTNHYSTAIDWRVLILATLVIGLFAFLYDLFAVAAPARFQILFGNEGLRIFSQIMVINTVLCAALGIFAARIFTNPNLALPIGLALNILGSLCTFLATPESRWLIYLGALVFTLGEVVFMAISSYILMRLIPGGKNQGSIYGTLLTFQMGFKTLGAAFAFPLVVYGSHPGVFITFVGSAGLACWWVCRRDLVRVVG